MNQIIKNVIFIIVGAAIFLSVELQIIKLSEILTIIVGLIGFLAMIDGVFGLYKNLKHKE